MLLQSETEAQGKYCRCVMKVRPKFAKDQSRGAPYGICTKSVLQKYMVSRPIKCDYGDYDQYTVDELLAYADELVSRKRFPMKPLTKKAATGDKAAIIRALVRYDQSRIET